MERTIRPRWERLDVGLDEIGYMTIILLKGRKEGIFLRLGSLKATDNISLKMELYRLLKLTISIFVFKIIVYNCNGDKFITFLIVNFF